MSIASASQTRLGFVTEVTWGTTPASPAFQKLRYTSESLNFDAETVTSNEIRSDRNVSDLARVGRQASGGFDGEMSYGTLDSLFESLFYSTWSANVLKNGVAQKSFSFEKTHELGASDSFMRYTGMIANDFTLRCEAKQLITSSMGFLGKGGTVGAAALAGATYPDPNDNEILSAAADFAALTMSGLTTPKLMRVELSISNNLRPQPVIGQEDLAGIGTGRFEVNGSISAYFENNDIYQKYLDGGASSLVFTIGTVTAEKYTWNLPTIKFKTGTVVAGGNDQDVMADMTFQALYNSGIAATAQLTRAVA